MKNCMILFSILLLFSCNQQTKEVKQPAIETETKALICYGYINKKDTVLLKTIIDGNAVTGTLLFHLDGKDRSMGNIQGYMEGPLLIADYTFFSEGITSVRQVVFKKDGSTFLEGYGEVEDKNGKIKFKHIESLDYSNSFLLQAKECVN